jgi:ketosteroid isomerase-like protein
VKTLTALLTIGVFLMTPAIADDADDVKAAFMSLFAAINAWDSHGLIQLYTPGYTNFGRGGGLLETTASLEERRKARQATFDAAKLNLQPRNVEVQVYGNTAVVTAYLVGTANPPNGETARWTDRRTGVWIKQGGKWKEAHMHQSPVRLPQ